MEIRATFIHQLSAYESRLALDKNSIITSKWDELNNPKAPVTCEELVLRNTFINA